MSMVDSSRSRAIHQANGKIEAAIAAKRKEQPPQKGGTWPLVKLGMGLTGRLMWVMPDLAEKWLAKSLEGHRNINFPTTQMIGRSLLDDDWDLNGDTIVFNVDDELCDGRHRLTACVETRKPLLTLVVWGIPKKGFDSIDAGRSRAPRDALKAAGITNQNVLAATVNILYRVDHKMPQHSFKDKKRLKLSPSEVVRYVKERPRLRECVNKAYKCGVLLHNKGAAGALYYIGEKIDKGDCEEFFTKLYYGAEMDRNDPILVARNFLMSERRTPNDTLHILFNAWNLWRKGEALKSVNDIPRPYDRPLPDLV